MASTAHSTRRKANLFGFSGKSTTFSSKVLKDAYDAGYKGQGGHRDFTAWLGKQKGSGEFHSKFVGQLRGEYARGEKDYFTAGPREVAQASVAVVKAPHKWKYKGYTIEQAGEDFIVPKLDRESQFESLAEAKRFIMSNPAHGSSSKKHELLVKITTGGKDYWNAYARGPKERLESEAKKHKFVEGHYKIIPYVRGNPKRGPIESTVTGATRTGVSVGRYLDSQLGKVLSNPSKKFDTESPARRFANLMSMKGAHVIGPGKTSDGKWTVVYDDTLPLREYKLPSKSNPGSRLTQGGATAYITELDSGVYVAEVVAPSGAREEKEFKGRGGHDAAKGWARLRLWEVAGKGNPEVNYIVSPVPGSGGRYQLTWRTPDGKTVVVGKYSDYEHAMAAKKKDWASRQKKGKRNPESSAASMYQSFHGRPSQEVVVIERDEHYHENVSALGTACGVIINCPTAGLVTIGMSGYQWQGKVPKGKWHKTDGGFVKADPAAEDVLLSTNEEGTQLFFDGGDQELDVSVLGLKGAAADKESIIIGDCSFIAYETEKEFDGFELIQYVHQFSEDSGGPLPVLRYDCMNKQMYLDGGVYFIEQPVMGVSPGIED